MSLFLLSTIGRLVVIRVEYFVELLDDKRFHTVLFPEVEYTGFFLIKILLGESAFLYISLRYQFLVNINRLLGGDFTKAPVSVCAIASVNRVAVTTTGRLSQASAISFCNFFAKSS